MSITKAWDWTKNTSEYWRVPCIESSYLAENWYSKGFRNFLDLGCGLGRHSIYMAKKGFNVTAVDLSDYAINDLNNWAKSEDVCVETQVCNMLKLPFSNNSFDCLMAVQSIYHTDTKGFIESLNEIKRVLKASGELFITLISKNTWSYQNTDNYKRIDENTILRDDDITELDVPHFYVNLSDILKLFIDFEYLKQPLENCEYNIETVSYYSKHWTLILKKK